LKAIGYVEHALSVMEDHCDGDEVRRPLSLLPPVHYLMVKPRGRWLEVSHGRTSVASRYVIQHCDGVSPVCQLVSEFVLCEAHHIGHSASIFDEAKRWFEAATVICRFVPEGRQRAEKAWLGNRNLRNSSTDLSVHLDIGKLRPSAVPVREEQVNKDIDSDSLAVFSGSSDSRACCGLGIVLTFWVFYATT
jgi:hypothetical protein